MSWWQVTSIEDYGSNRELAYLPPIKQFLEVARAMTPTCFCNIMNMWEREFVEQAQERIMAWVHIMMRWVFVWRADVHVKIEDLTNF